MMKNIRLRPDKTWYSVIELSDGIVTFDDYVVEVSEEMYNRWKRINDEFKEMQLEMGLTLKKKDL